MLAEARGERVQDVGMPTFRPFYFPVALGAIAGPHVGMDFSPVRRTALHGWHARRGAVFMDCSGGGVFLATMGRSRSRRSAKLLPSGRLSEGRISLRLAKSSATSGARRTAVESIPSFMAPLWQRSPSQDFFRRRNADLVAASRPLIV